MSDLIREGLQRRKKELITQMDACLSEEARHLLDGLFTTPDEQNHYRLTLLKTLSQSTQPAQIKEVVADFDILSQLHYHVDGALTTLGLGAIGVRYFAGSVQQSKIFQMQRRDENDQYIHASAFIAHQFYRCQDNMIDLWLSVMASFQSATGREYQEKIVLERQSQQRQIKLWSMI